MKISIVIAEGVKQIMFTPETDHEKQALEFISPTDYIEIAQKWGTYDNKPSHFGSSSAFCQGGYVRRFADEESLMFVLTEKKTTPPSSGV